VQPNELMQSAYKQFHSTETALTRVQNDILDALDTHGAAVLVLLDLSAAFDTIDHKILLKRLEEEMGVSGAALAWFASYLSGRTQAVLIDGTKSEKLVLDFGVPQGSVFGPYLFVTYTRPLGDIVRKHGLQFHIYADDTQLYLAFNPLTPGSIEDVKTRVENCVKEIKEWMAKNFLKLNDDKTELILMRKHTLKESELVIRIGDHEVTPSTEARNLGVIFDSICNMEKQVSAVCRSAFYQIWNIGSIRRYLDQQATATLIHALVTSRLDYCNSLLFGINKKLVKRLQRVQNAAARLLTQGKKYDRMTPVRRDLHWLPIAQRIEYKILLLTFKALNGQAPKYLTELLQLCTVGRNEMNSVLRVPKVNHATWGDRAFKKAAPRLWNSLPPCIRNSDKLSDFKKQLKTHLFNKGYEGKS